MAMAASGTHNQITKFFYDTKTPYWTELATTLGFVQENTHMTPNGRKFSRKHQEVHFEVARFAQRMHLMQLLLDRKYDAFIENAPEPIITRDNFDRLSDAINLIRDHQDTMKVAQAIGAVPLSPEAKKRAEAKGVEYPSDTVQFSAVTVDRCPDIYPAWNTLDDESKQQLKAAFPHSTHFRHMLFVEGNAKMFNELREGIQNDSITRDDFNFWAAYWLINLAGFSVSKDATPGGTQYCNNHIAAAALKLIEHLEQLFDQPEYDVLGQYLSYRAELVGFDHATKTGKLKAQFACMLDVFTDCDQARAISNAIDSYLDEADEATKDRILSQFDPDQAKAAPTYKPALLKNLLAASKDVELAVGITMQVAEQSEFAPGILAKRQAEDFIVSYRVIAGKEQSIPGLIAQYRRDGNIAINVNDRGEILLSPGAQPSATPFRDLPAAAGAGSDADQKPRYILALIPTEDHVAKALKQMANDRYPNEDELDAYQLGANSSAHASVLQFEIDADTDEQTRALMQEAITKELATYTVQLQPVLYQKADGYHELRFTQDCQAVHDLHKRLLAQFQEQGLETRNACGDAYKPHFTLFKLHSARPDQTSIELPDELKGEIQCSVGWGRADNRWQLVQVEGIANTNRQETEESPAP